MTDPRTIRINLDPLGSHDADPIALHPILPLALHPLLPFAPRLLPLLPPPPPRLPPPLPRHPLFVPLARFVHRQMSLEPSVRRKRLAVTFGVRARRGVREFRVLLQSGPGGELARREGEREAGRVGAEVARGCGERGSARK